MSNKINDDLGFREWMHTVEEALVQEDEDEANAARPAMVSSLERVIEAVEEQLGEAAALPLRELLDLESEPVRRLTQAERDERDFAHAREVMERRMAREKARDDQMEKKLRDEVSRTCPVCFTVRTPAGGCWC